MLINFFRDYSLVLLVLVLAWGFVASLFISVAHVDLVRFFALGVSVVALLLGLRLGLGFDKTFSGFQYLFRIEVLAEYNLDFTLGLDGLSFLFLRLTLFIFPLCFLSAWTVTKHTKQFFSHLLIRELLLVLTFTTTDLLFFFVFFESLLIPRLILIGVWGARERKIQAAYYFFLYTLAGSLARLAGRLYLYNLAGSLNYLVILTFPLDEFQQKRLWVLFFLAFAIKIPLFPFHIWLPEAHVEAPTVGSMLLASLLLKRGGYGFLRFSLTRFPEACVFFAPLVATIAVLGVVYGSIATIRQIDLKRIIAYSSVAHRNLVRLGLFSGTHQGIAGATYLRLAHGIVSAALFLCVGVLYDRYHTRLIRYYGGLVTVRPRFSGAFFLFTRANRSFPGTSNFLGEIILFRGIYSNNTTVLVFSASGIVLSAVYSTWMYNRVIFGPLKTEYLGRFTDITRRETLIFAFFALEIVLLGLFGDFILEYVEAPIKTILAGFRR